ncbi:glycoside hydrolase family 3 C-terminal domain-containing protein [Streptomyces sp. TRM66268-LWL]|uniref:Glycoside hydrolase family 3 C-terminal domain-containing protein n=1 Tax=Streptomyces polyasparticus TaxID=2767826 RepID=A0ABR7S6A7_9ACTN|nr:glycoside hydrolase family 3 C-terminal domain-containing protein [Streptomyces polyasparticus]MBC9711006.1 glycoside hydrolase family 3 C-terminal domain-containing protein [Streptomyces polyasparticus]
MTAAGTTSRRLDIPALLAALTREEKAALLDGSDFWHTEPVERLGIPSVMLSDGPHGLRKQPEDGDHLGLLHSVPATCFPPAAGLASSWDTALLTRVGEALGREARAERVSVLLGPGVNMKRSPLCGRNFEYFSEDPYLAGELGAAWVEGVQSQGVGASLKHYVANNQETDRMTVSAEIDERTLREIYLPAFEAVVTKAQPWTVMSSYNKVNGRYVAESRELLTEILRDGWGFEGLVVSDWGGIEDRPASLAAGADLEMPSSGGTGARALLDALDDGRLTEADLDRAVTRLLTLVDRALPALDEAPAGFDADAHHALAREAAAASAVLLKNEDGLLPLDPDAGGSLAVIGEFARTPRFQGAGSSQVNPTRVDTALDALRAALDGRREVTFSPGYVIESEQADPELVDEAFRAAAKAEVAVVFLGLPASYESEGFDRTHMELPAHQVELLHAVTTANPRTVVVLSNGSAVTLAPWQDRVPAVLETWLLGQGGGAACADLLLGTANPSGRLAETLPLRYEDTPAFGAFPGEFGRVRYAEGLLIGYRWYDTRRAAVAYPFGHGLSYTTYDYSDLVTTVKADGDDPLVEVSVRVTNTGERAGSETVQLYVTDPEASVQRPEQELRAFARVFLAPGESERVTLTLTRRAFAYWHEGAGRWTVEGGTFGLRVGASSRDIRLETSVELAGDGFVAPLAAASTAEQWLGHPAAGPWLREALGTEGFAGIMFDPHNGAMMRAIPLSRLVRFPGFPVDAEQVAVAVEKYAGS